VDAVRSTPNRTGVHPFPTASLAAPCQVGAVIATAWARDCKGAAPGHPVTNPVTNLPSPAYRRAVPAYPAGDLEGPMKSHPVHRSILAVDIERSTSPLRTNPIKEELRTLVYCLLTEAMATAGIHARHCDPFEDRGDGVLTLIQPADEVPKTLLFHPLIPALSQMLSDYNISLPESERPRRELRLRTVLHAGEIHRDGNGYFGEALDVACRLLDAPRLKKCLQQVAAPLVLVVSEDLYHSIVRHHYEGICHETFHPVVRVHVAGRRHRGWVHIPPAYGVLDTACADGGVLPAGRGAVSKMRRQVTVGHAAA
jgi:hypothetical protein